MILPIFITRTEKFLAQRSTEAKAQRRKVVSICRSVFFRFASLRVCVFALIFFLPISAQRIVFLSPDAAEASRTFAEKLAFVLDKKFRVLDKAMGEAAFFSAKAENPFNLTTDGSKAVGAAIGCDYFILVSSATLRRSSSKRHEYYESHAAIYAVSSRTGRLVHWRLLRFEALTAEESRKNLSDGATALAFELEDKLKSTTKDELAEATLPEMEEPPEEASPAAKNFRTPIPYRRIKPEYTTDAFLFDIKATVDIVVDLDKTGGILRTEIVRWAGYGLDESVEKAVRSMNWRPAMRNGKPVAMRFLLRYNFKKVEKE